jgi:pimeloyl-[acyl-carrier protein] methyl ester esterase
MDITENITILLLPGMDGTGILLQPLAEILSAHFSVQVISYPNNQALSYDDLVAFVLDNSPDGRLVILGESFSGPVAIEIAARERRVAGLILASSFARSPMPSFLAPLAKVVDLSAIPRAIIEFALLGRGAPSNVKARLGQVLATVPGAIIRARALQALNVDKRSQLRAVTCPLLFLYGRFDRLVRRRYADEIISSHSNARLRVFDASHTLLAINVPEAAEAIILFCRQLSS